MTSMTGMPWRVSVPGGGRVELPVSDRFADVVDDGRVVKFFVRIDAEDQIFGGIGHAEYSPSCWRVSVQGHRQTGQ